MMFQRFFLTTFVFSGMIAALPEAAQAQCNQCSDQASCNKCCRPHHTKIIVWRSNIVSGGLSPVMGGAPPQGFAVSSVPAMMVAQPALAISPAAFTVGVGSAGVSAADIDAAVARRLGTASASAAAANNTCPDPCGDIKQLQQDVKDLKALITKTTLYLESVDSKLKSLPQ